MISDKDRAYYIGASDTGFVVGNWTTRTFERWYLTKLGLDRIDYESEAMMAGTAYEHRILDSLSIPDLEMDRQVIIGRLRINLDGNTKDTIYEVKTYGADRVFRVSKQYREQVQVQMYATGIRKAYIVAYGLEDADYRNFYRDIDPGRLSIHEIKYDEAFITGKYLPRVKYLSQCIDCGKFPMIEEVGDHV